MKLWPWSKRRNHGVTPAQLNELLRARYDAAQTTDDNRLHWAMSDALSADASAAPDVRRTLRNRARYEVANNSYAKGIVLTMANDCIGTGPRLQLLSENAEINRLGEQAFAQWAQAVDLAAKLRCMRMAKATDGEAFGVLTSNLQVNSPVQLDIALVEADRVASPLMSLTPSESDVDGVILDPWGMPSSYTVRRHHPGDPVVDLVEVDTIAAEAMIHWFRADRPGQHRGIPEITPALPLFAQLRRYTLAVITAAETAADLAVIMKTTMLNDGEAADVDPMTLMDLVRNMAMFVPEGWEPQQLKAEQPTTAYGEFKREILNEIARCLNLPFNIAACNSSGYNYASGRLDHQTYYKSLRVEQAHLENAVLNRILAAWLQEASLVPELAALRTLRGTEHQWFYDGTEHVDPAKEATAQATRLSSNTTTLATEYARQGRDWETELRQRAKEAALMKELGLTAQPTAPQDSPPDEEGDDEQEDSKEQQAA